MLNILRLAAAAAATAAACRHIQRQVPRAANATVNRGERNSDGGLAGAHAYGMEVWEMG